MNKIDESPQTVSFNAIQVTRPTDTLMNTHKYSIIEELKRKRMERGPGVAVDMHARRDEAIKKI